MSIPYSQFRDAPAMATVNAEFKAREDALHYEYIVAVTAVHMACQHNWGTWEHRTKQCCTGSLQRYERSCTLCGCMTAQEEKPETDQPIKETSDSFIDAY